MSTEIINASTNGCNPGNPSELLTVARVCEEYGVGKTSLYDVLAENKMRAKVLGKRGTRIRRADVEFWIKRSVQDSGFAGRFGQPAVTRGARVCCAKLFAEGADVIHDPETATMCGIHEISSMHADITNRVLGRC